ncbi:MAG: hypothetical protein IT307_18030, partial [Chloroflexi bacterium]|nr:hypothetical protein [Chloroflexota bacterium]
MFEDFDVALLAQVAVVLVACFLGAVVAGVVVKRWLFADAPARPDPRNERALLRLELANSATNTLAVALGFTPLAAIWGVVQLGRPAGAALLVGIVVGVALALTTSLTPIMDASLPLQVQERLRGQITAALARQLKPRVTIGLVLPSEVVALLVLLLPERSTELAVLIGMAIVGLVHANA